jgi:hypothetical protein
VRVLLTVVVTDSDSPADSEALADDTCWYTLPGRLAVVVASVTGQTVVYKLMTSVVTWPIRAGQFVTVGAQDVIV